MSQDLVGRPLVPFFDADENVNVSLEVDLTTRAIEHIDVDARVWDKERGYFVYPNEDPAPRVQPQQQPRPMQTSAPIAITPRNGRKVRENSGPMLLTPDMLSRSAPDASTFRLPPTTPILPSAVSPDKTRIPARSSSAKRATRTRGTPRKGQARSGAEQSSPQEPVQETRSAPGSTKKTRAKQRKSKDDSAVAGKEKWAWSAFQSSPDPKMLPLPPAPFVVADGDTSPQFNGHQPPLLQPPTIQERLDPPHAIPPLPPDAAEQAFEQAAQSIEHSMTQDLRRLLNIGGM